MNFKHVNAAVFSIGLLALAGGITLFVLSRTSDTVTTPSSVTNTTGTNTPSTTPARSDAPLYFTTMTHMEGNFKDDRDEALFRRHVDDIRAAMDAFDAVGAKLTIESEQSFAKANTIWDTNILQEVVDRGHGVGTHADFGAEQDERMTFAQYVERFKENKSLVDTLVGTEQNQGVSGGFGAGEWVKAASEAGFKYLDGLTAFGYLSMPLKNRPEGFTNAYIRREAYHDSIPPEFEDRLYMYDLKDATDLVPDTDGVLTIMGGELGELASVAEGRSTCAPDCDFDEEDIAAVVAAIKQADEIRDRSRVARLNLHIPTSLLTADERPMLEKFLEAIKPYVEDGTMIFATQLKAYEGYEQF